MVVERMIRQCEIDLSELQRWLDTLEKQEQIPVEEHQALLELAREAESGRIRGESLR